MSMPYIDDDLDDEVDVARLPRRPGGVRPEELHPLDGEALECGDDALLSRILVHGRQRRPEKPAAEGIIKADNGYVRRHGDAPVMQRGHQMDRKQIRGTENGSKTHDLFAKPGYTLVQLVLLRPQGQIVMITVLDPGVTQGPPVSLKTLLVHADRFIVRHEPDPPVSQLRQVTHGIVCALLIIQAHINIV